MAVGWHVGGEVQVTLEFAERHGWLSVEEQGLFLTVHSRTFQDTLSLTRCLTETVRCCQILLVAVATSSRRKGVGRALLSELLDRAER